MEVKESEAMRWFRRSSESQPESPHLTAAQLKRRLDRGEAVLVVDVRQPHGYQQYPGQIPGALRIPPAELPERYQRLPRDQLLVLTCT